MAKAWSLLDERLDAVAATARQVFLVRLAVGCGTANTRSVGAGRFDPRDATRFAGLSRVTELTGSAV
jgi:hypothetical protein